MDVAADWLRCTRTFVPEPAATVSAAILVGGGGYRMGGRDKSQITMAGQPLLKSQVARLAHRFRRLLLVGGTSCDMTHPENTSVDFVSDPVLGQAPYRPNPQQKPLNPSTARQGPLAGIHAALTRLTPPETHVFVLACDMPYVPTTLVNHICDVQGDAEIVLTETTDGRVHPLCARYAKTLERRLGAFLRSGQRRAQTFVTAQEPHIIKPAALASLDLTGRALTNLNTPEDLIREELDLESRS